MRRLSTNLAGCGCLLLTLAVVGYFIGTATSQRAITILFDIANDQLGSPLYAAIALGGAGVALILIATSFELLSGEDEGRPAKER